MNNYTNQITGSNILPNYIFAGCKKLKTDKITFIDNIDTIGVGACLGCTSFISFPNNNQFITVNKYGFKDCINLENVDLSNCTYLGDFAFKNCSSLSYVQIDKVSDLDKLSIFENCKNLEKVDLSSNVKVCGKQIFKGCSKLWDISLDELTEIKDLAFMDCSYLGTQKQINLNKVTKFGNYAFANCSGLSYINLNKSTNIEFGEGVFMNCINIKEIEFSSYISNFSPKMFEGCKKLEKVIFNKDIEGTINLNALNKCTKMKEISINNTTDNSKYKTINNQCILDTQSKTLIYVVKNIGMFEINSQFQDLLTIDDHAFDHCKLSILSIQGVNAPEINQNTFANVDNKNFKVIINIEDPKYNKYLNILGADKIIYYENK